MFSLQLSEGLRGQGEAHSREDVEHAYEWGLESISFMPAKVRASQQASETGATSCPSYSHLCTVLMYRARMFIPNFFAPLLYQYIRLQRKKIIQGEMAFCPSHNTENDPLVRPTAKPFRSPGFFGGTETFKQRTSSWRPPLFILVQLISSFPPSPAVAVMLYVKLTGG